MHSYLSVWKRSEREREMCVSAVCLKCISANSWAITGESRERERETVIFQAICYNHHSVINQTFHHKTRMWGVGGGHIISKHFFWRCVCQNPRLHTFNPPDLQVNVLRPKHTEMGNQYRINTFLYKWDTSAL